jgi:hypothetical protein
VRRSPNRNLGQAFSWFLNDGYGTAFDKALHLANGDDVNLKLFGRWVSVPAQKWTVAVGVRLLEGRPTLLEPNE